MIFKRFIFFHFVVFGTMLPAYAQHTPNVDSEHNKTMEKKFQESVDVKGKNNLALPADDSVSIKTRLTIAGRKVESEADQGLKTQSREIKNASSAISQEVKANIGSTKQALNDSVPVWKKVKPQKNDSLNLNVTYENRKLVLPDKASDIQNLGDQLPNLSNSKLNKESLPKNVPGLNTKQGVQEKARTNLSDLSNQIPGTGNRTTDLLDKPDNQLQKNEAYRKVKNYSDSITQRVEKGQAFVGEIKGGVPDVNHIYSSKTLQKLYDSLGISKIDSVMALAASKDEVSKEELLKQVNSSFPSSSLNDKLADQQNVSNPSDLTSLKDKVPASEFSNSPQLTSLQDKASGMASMRDQVAGGNLSDMKLSVSDLQELAPLSGFQLPTDSIPVLADLRKLNLSKEKIKLTETETKEKFKSALIKEKPTLKDNAYFDAVISFADSKDFNSFQMSPSFGYRIKDNLSLGIGPNMIIKQKHNVWDASVGFRSFVKYEVFSQRGYFQVEDMVDPASVNQEYISRTRHSILTGVGVLLPLTRTVAINLSIFYRVNNDDYSSGKKSPWVIRLGLSSIKKKKKNELK